MALATEKRKKLRRQIIEEDLSYLVVSKITEAIKDPTRMQSQQLEGLQKEIFDQLMKTAGQCTVHELISYHRLAGRTVFNFSKHYHGIRLETFYNKVYKEPYYLLFLNKNREGTQGPKHVDKHTIPKFIPVEVLANRFLPENMETFLRIVHDCVQAFVSRRELLNELEKLSSNVEVIYKNGSNTKVEFKLESFEDNKVPIVITMLFNSYASSFPTNITVRDFDTTQEAHNHGQMEQELMHDDPIDVFTRYIGGRPSTPEDARENVHNILDDMVEEDEEEGVPSNTSPKSVADDNNGSVISESMDMEVD